MNGENPRIKKKSSYQADELSDSNLTFFGDQMVTLFYALIKNFCTAHRSHN